MNTIIEKIRAEVNKLPEEYKGLYKQFGNSLGFIDALDMVKKILSDLEKEEKPTTAEGLEEEIERMYLKDILTLRTRAQYADLARHFAQWQKEQILKEAVDSGMTVGDIIRKLWDVPEDYKVVFCKEGDKVKLIIVKEN